MSNKTHSQLETYQIHPIGYVRRNGAGIQLEINQPFRSALKELEHFSHVMVFWWANHVDDAKSRQVLVCNPPYAQEHETGIFATRSPLRPNPIAMTTCKLLKVDQAGGAVQIADIDALDGTPVVDLKAYFPVCDRVEHVRIPDWLTGWPEWMPEDGIGLMEGEG